MTSTSTFKGMESGNKPSSRVLAPPGGGSSNIFGNTPVQAPPKKETAPAQSAPAQSAPVQPTQQSNQAGRNIASAPKQAYNPITGEPYEVTKKDEKKDNAQTNGADGTPEKKEETNQPPPPKPSTNNEVKEKTSTRVAQPPGGKSSGIF